MKTKLTITVDESVKKNIQELAKRMGSNVSVLTNMFYVSAINTGNIHYYDVVDTTGEKLYKQYLESDKEDQKDDFSICNDSNNKQIFFDNLNTKLWS